PWMKKFGKVSTAFASGWMQIRGNRRRRGIDRGFVVSDHADWNGLLDAIAATGAERIGVTHGFSETLVRYLKERGMDAFPIRTEYEPEGEDA
ncbi:MAG: DNA ligase-associated DEXH box helicase, partial [Candidatus Omnitrophica bacterium]|nr:DNA ligase-associated DEXH box helicase [Candidatus Omnitrophota bacterium]